MSAPKCQTAEAVQRSLQAMLSGAALCEHLIHGASDGFTPDLAIAVRETLVGAHDSLEMASRTAGITQPATSQDDGVMSADRLRALDLLQRAYLLVGPMALHGNLLFHGCLDWENADSPRLDPKALMGIGKHLLLAHDQFSALLESLAELMGITDLQGEFDFRTPMVKGGGE